MPRIRSGSLLLAATVLLTLSGCAPQASCAAPEVTLSSATVEQGGELTVDVTNLAAGCGDTGQGAAAPASDVPITLVSGSDVITLSTVDADADYSVSTTVRVPIDAPTGAASIQVDSDYSAPVTITPAP